MYEGAASCKDIAWAPVTNCEPQCVTLAGYCYAVGQRDESSARNSVTCQSLATLRRYDTR
jgi:hypothetical protein